MILHKKNAKKLKHFGKTIDLKYMEAKEYVDKVEKNNTMIGNFKKNASTAGLVWFVITIIAIWLLIPLYNITKPSVAKASDTDIQQSIRLERLNACQKAYSESGIQEQFLYKQVPAVRCATYMTLIYGYESKFEGKVGNSRLCRELKNCFGMRGNGVETPKGWINFNTENDARAYFAKKYFKYHYKKDIKNFVFTWSQTDRDTYISFMKKRYWKTYNELERLYMTNGK